jgi:FkbM family methyltransferase
MIINPYDPGIGSELIVRGIHEKHCTRELKRRLRPGMHTIDIGANIGYYALMEARLVGPEGRVYAIEPVPENFQLLKRNVTLNGFEDRVRIFQLAIGDVSGIARMNLSTFSTRHSFVARPEREQAGILEVPMVSFEDFVAKEEVDLERLGLIRMDVEGFEVKIIPGMARTLRRCKELSLCIEFHQRKFGQIPGASWRGCLRVLQDVGVHIDRLHYGGPHGKVIIQDVTMEQFMASERLMALGGMESWMTVGARSHRGAGRMIAQGPLHSVGAR